MSSQVNEKSTFENLKKAIIKNRKTAVVNKDKDLASLAFAELTYSVASDKSETISFKAIGLDLILNENDGLMLLESESGEVTVYELEEGPVANRIRKYLVWRIETLEEVGF